MVVANPPTHPHQRLSIHQLLFHLHLLLRNPQMDLKRLRALIFLVFRKMIPRASYRSQISQALHSSLAVSRVYIPSNKLIIEQRLKQTQYLTHILIPILAFLIDWFKVVVVMPIVQTCLNPGSMID